MKRVGTVGVVLAVAVAVAACGSKERATTTPPADAAVVTITPDASAAPAASVRGKVLIGKDVVWVVGAGGGQRVLPCGADGLDTAAIIGALCALQGDAGDPAVEVAAAAGLPIGRMFALLDALRELGVRDVAALTPETLDLRVRGAADSLPVVAARCGQRPDPCPALARGAVRGADPLRRRGVRAAPPQASAGDAVVTTTLLALSPAGISIDGRQLAEAGELAAGGAAEPIAALVEALRGQGAAWPVLIAATPDTPSLFLSRALASCTAAGRTQFSFASPADGAPPPPPPRRATP